MIGVKDEWPKSLLRLPRKLIRIIRHHIQLFSSLINIRQIVIQQLPSTAPMGYFRLRICDIILFLNFLPRNISSINLLNFNDNRMLNRSPLINNPQLILINWQWLLINIPLTLLLISLTFLNPRAIPLLAASSIFDIILDCVLILFYKTAVQATAVVRLNITHILIFPLSIKFVELNKIKLYYNLF